MKVQVTVINQPETLKVSQITDNVYVSPSCIFKLVEEQGGWDWISEQNSGLGEQLQELWIASLFVFGNTPNTANKESYITKVSGSFPDIKVISLDGLDQPWGNGTAIQHEIRHIEVTTCTDYLPDFSKIITKKLKKYSTKNINILVFYKSKKARDYQLEKWLKCMKEHNTQDHYVYSLTAIKKAVLMDMIRYANESAGENIMDENEMSQYQYPYVILHLHTLRPINADTSRVGIKYADYIEVRGRKSRLEGVKTSLNAYTNTSTTTFIRNVNLLFE